MKALLASTFIATFFCHSAMAGTVAYYEFNGTGVASVGSTVTDSTGSHNGTVVGGDLLYGTDPLMGSYLHFAADGPSVGGLGNRVEVPGSSALVFTSSEAYTIEAIFRTTQTLTNGVMLSKGSDVSNPDSQWWLRHRGDGRMQGLVEGDDKSVNANAEESASSTNPPRFDDGLWHQVALVYDGTLTAKRIDIYVDGVLRGSDTAIVTAGTIGGTDLDPVIFGEFATLVANRSFEGDLAAVRFSNAALTPAEFLTVVPEPSITALALLGGMVIIFRRTR